jgi:hypothetical protein
MYRTLGPLSLACLLLMGCEEKKPAPPPPAEVRPTATRPSQHGATGVGDTEPAPVLVPPKDSRALALFSFKASAPDTCEVLLQQPSGESTRLFSFDAACTGSKVAWSPDGKEAVLFHEAGSQAEKPRAWRVDVAGQTGTPVDLGSVPGIGTGSGASKPHVAQVDFDSHGRIVALVAQELSNDAVQVVEGSRALPFEGASYLLKDDFSKQEGVVPGLAHAYALEGGAWSHLETKATHYGRAGEKAMPGISALDVKDVLQPMVAAPARG